jgi:hypothetical protein
VEHELRTSSAATAAAIRRTVIRRAGIEVRE